MPKSARSSARRSARSRESKGRSRCWSSFSNHPNEKAKNMNSISKHLLCLAGMLLAPLGHAQTGGSYDLSWSKIAAGGGGSSGGQFTLNGTVGQPDAGALVGGKYQLE